MPLIQELYTKEYVDCTETSCRVVVRYNQAHPLYAGHFPEMPVTPGVCLIQTATELLGEVMGTSLRLTNARQIKFLKMHTPERELRFELSWSEESDRLRGRISIFQEDVCMAKIDAHFTRT